MKKLGPFVAKSQNVSTNLSDKAVADQMKSETEKALKNLTSAEQIEVHVAV